MARRRWRFNHFRDRRLNCRKVGTAFAALWRAYNNYDRLALHACYHNHDFDNFQLVPLHSLKILLICLSISLSVLHSASAA